jgi:hypothetical protein
VQPNELVRAAAIRDSFKRLIDNDRSMKTWSRMLGVEVTAPVRNAAERTDAGRCDPRFVQAPHRQRRQDEGMELFTQSAWSSVMAAKEVGVV